ncbi:hypothetical protein SAMN05444380_1523, partial [Thermophagus xiamenensis]
ANVPNFGVFCLLKDSDNSFSVKEIEYFGISLNKLFKVESLVSRAAYIPFSSRS